MVFSTRVQPSGKRRIFNRLRRWQQSSRALLAQECGLTRPAVSAIIDEMVRDGLVRETGCGVSTGGKPPRLLELVGGSRCAIGVDLGDDYLIRGVLGDLAGNVLYSSVQEYENRFPAIVEAVVELIRTLRSRVAVPESLIGIGVAVSGIVDVARNEVVGYSTLDLVNRGLAEVIASSSGLPVLLERRPNAGALAESLFGAGREFGTLLFITSGRGVGAGMVIDGRIYRGCSGTAGEIGRLLVEGKPLEECTRPSVLAREFSFRKGRPQVFGELLAAYRAGDPDAAELLHRNAEMMAYAAQAAADLFDPEAVVLGGRVLEFGDAYFTEFSDAFAAHAASRLLGGSCVLRRSFFGSSGVAVGGAQIVLDRVVD